MAYLVAALQHDHFLVHMLADASLEGSYDSRPRTPGDVKARHRVAVAIRLPPSALSSADDGKPAHPSGVKPGSHLPRGEINQGFGDPARPMIFRSVELCRAQPIL